ncbi:MAG: hypothetical protein JWL96_1178 [Sphingomonas bacterium]|uniref:tetratricopeptide repeat protein n=1 Tax=Sphingomonas bacterium TaxID=1895847 RepID=UPI0026368E24|nr:hypothetical protein [Sphingomonas bacterium]MDB5709108.1 hypothetical protein [Sphingomonas bacterium]
MAHYFLFSALKPERARQFHDYMVAIHQGTPMAEAAKVFGDMNRLQRELASYAISAKSFTRSAPDTPVSEPGISNLSPGASALVQARVELGTRLAVSPEGLIAPDEARRRDAWMARVRAAAAGAPGDSDVLSFAAEAECRSGHARQCLSDAEAVLVRSPSDVAALAWKGVALTDLAIAGPAGDRATGLAAARTTIERATALDGAAPLPSIALFQSYTKAGETVPDQAMLGMARVVRAVPAAPGPRLYLAEELLRQGKADMARRVAYTVLNGPYDSPEKTVAATLFPPAGGPPTAGR